jgi:hypothetical protein
LWRNSITFALGALAAALSTWLGTIEVFDLSVNYQSALRMVQGQKLYTDFYIPNGPVAALVLMPFARFFSPGSSLLFSSALLNAVATLVADILLRRLHVPPLFRYLGVVLTAIWFLPPMGAFYHDHLAYLFVLIAIATRSQWTSAFFIALAFHTKQTVGGPATIAFIVSRIFFSEKPRRMRSALGYLVRATVMTGLLCLLWAFFFGWRNYSLYTLEYPGEYLGSSGQLVKRVLFELLASIFFPFRINPVRMFEEWGKGRLFYYPVVVAIYFCFWALWFPRRKDLSHLYENLARLVLSTLWCGALLGRSFIHLFFGTGISLAIAFALTLKSVSYSRGITLATGGLLALIGIVFIIYGRGIARPSAIEYRKTAIHPLRIVDTYHTQALYLIADHIRRNPGDYYLTDNVSAPVALALGTPPVNPCVDYHIGTAVPGNPERRLKWQSDLVDKLAAIQVRYVIRVRDRLLTVPLTLMDEYLKANFRRIIHHGTHELYESNRFKK